MKPSVNWSNLTAQNMIMESNPQIELAFEYVSLTNKNIFLTGKAGTGKTTFLHRVRNEVIKRMAVVAPTGVAAINAEGVTIHSLFQLPFGPLVPGQVEGQISQRRFSKQKIALIKSLDLLIIDEISMVRADVLDAIDAVLRRYKNYSQPFGGLQLLMIGDLHQLPPVVRTHEWELLQPHYKTPYFFGSQALIKTGAVRIELKHIYRQADNTFIEILNKVRNNQMDASVLEALNSRYLPDFQPDDEDSYITLSSHNKTARDINEEKLDSLAGKVHTFNAKVDGDFPEHSYPTEEKLSFKLNAQVMFVKNDLSEEKRYYNGKIGRITRIHGNLIFVRCPEDDRDIMVEADEWHNRKYSLDPETKEVKEELIGTFTQHPLKLAWAITIHKSQGLTFEKVIIDAQAAFAHGQVYVALSRCKTFEGIVLRTELYPSSVKTDSVVSNYTKESQQNEPGEEELLKAKREYQQNLLRTYFEFKILKNRFNQFRKAIIENDKSLHGNILTEMPKFIQKAQDQVFGVGQTFLKQLGIYLNQPAIPEENEDLNARLQKAGGYFAKTIEVSLIPELKELEVLTDNKEARKKIKEKGEELQKELFINLACAKDLMIGFDSHRFNKAAVDADLDFQKSAKTKTSKKTTAPKDIAHPALYKLLSSWRWETAQEREAQAYQILTTRSILEIVEILPTNLTNLQRVHGIGKTRAKEFGEEILSIVVQFAKEFQLETDLLKLIPPKAPKPQKTDTKAISFDLFQKGKNISEIAQERGFTPSTIENHLAIYVSEGQLDINDVLNPKVVDEISEYFKSAKSVNLSKAKDHFGPKYGYGELRLVRASMGLDGKV